jgi:hypothetical protein
MKPPICQPLIEAAHIDLNKRGGLRLGQQFALRPASGTMSQNPMTHDSFQLEGRDLNPSSH